MRHKYLWLFCPAVMAAVCILQAVMVARGSGEIWKGGGFGMFSTASQYYVSLQWVNPDGSVVGQESATIGVTGAYKADVLPMTRVPPRMSTERFNSLKASGHVYLALATSYHVVPTRNPEHPQARQRMTLLKRVYDYRTNQMMLIPVFDKWIDPP